MILAFRRLPPPSLIRWVRESGERPSRHWAKVSADAGTARSIDLLIAPYHPYMPTAEGVTLSAFYVASNYLHRTVGKNELSLPIKPIITGYGIGAYGRSGLMAIPDIGTRFAAAVIGSDEAPDDKWVWDDARPLSNECMNCSECVVSCPTGALAGDGRLDVEKCLRAQAQYQQPPMPNESRSLIDTSAWGCEICQQNCPRNGDMDMVKMPKELEQALELKKLLTGDVSGLGYWIGTNYARPARMQARASMVAANLGRRDLTKEIHALLDSPVAAVRDCAAWALDKLNGGS